MSSAAARFWLLLLTAIACTRAPAPNSVESTSDGTLAVVDVTVVPVDRERVIAHQTVVVRGHRIVALGAVADVKVPPGAVRIDGRTKSCFGA